MLWRNREQETVDWLADWLWLQIAEDIEQTTTDVVGFGSRSPVCLVWFPLSEKSTEERSGPCWWWWGIDLKLLK